MESISEVVNGMHWGAHLNRNERSRTYHLPNWASTVGKREFQSCGVIVWDDTVQRIVGLSPSLALAFLKDIRTNTEWESEGLIVSEWEQGNGMAIPRTWIKPTKEELFGEKSLSTWRYSNKILLNPEQVRLFLLLLESQENALNMMMIEGERQFTKALAELAQLLQAFSEEKQANSQPIPLPRKPDLSDVDEEKLKRSIEKMCKALAIPIAVPGVYDLLAACENERSKASKTRRNSDSQNATVGTDT